MPDDDDVDGVDGPARNGVSEDMITETMVPTESMATTETMATLPGDYGNQAPPPIHHQASSADQYASPPGGHDGNHENGDVTRRVWRPWPELSPGGLRRNQRFVYLYEQLRKVGEKKRLPECNYTSYATFSFRRFVYLFYADNFSSLATSP